MRRFVVAFVLAGMAAVMAPAEVAVADTGTLTRISVSSSGLQANGASTAPVLTPDARYVVFASTASNLVDGDTNGVSDIFMYERATGAVTRVSIGSAGGQANGASIQPTISADGRLVAFRSTATNLVADVPLNISQIYLRDVIAGTTIVASTNSSGVPGDSFSSSPGLSADGTVVTFVSLARNLVPNDRNNTTDVFAHSLVNGSTILVSVGPTGVQVNSQAIRPAISSDGHLIAFESNSVLTPDATAFSAHIYLRDTAAGTTVLVANGALQSALSADGRFIAYVVSVVVGNSAVNVIRVRDLISGSSVIASVSNTGQLPSGVLINTLLPAISADGTHVAFWSDAPNLVVNDTNGGGDWFVRDLVAGTTSRVSLTASGAQDGATSITPSTPPGSLSGDGGFVVFESPAAGLVPADTNGVVDIFLRRVQAPNTIPAVAIGGDMTLGPGGTLIRDGTFVDPDPSQTWTATVDFGAGDGPQPLELGADKTFVLQNTYPSEGAFVVAVTVRDSAGGAGSATFVVTVQNTVPVIFAGSGERLPMAKELQRTIYFVDPDPGQTWTATVDYGDETGVHSVAVSDDQTIFLTHKYTRMVTLTVTVTVTDSAGGTGRAMFNVGVVPLRSFIFVHGFTGDAAAPGFDALLGPEALAGAMELPGQLSNFEYYQDKSHLTAAGCVNAPFDVARNTVGLPMDTSSHSLDPGICDSQSAVGINGILLDDLVREKQLTFGGHVTIIANSMGGAVTRAYLAYAVAASTHTIDFVDDVYFLQGAQQGSFVTLAKPLAIFLAGTDAASVLSEYVRRKYEYDTTRPAFTDLMPRSKVYQWVNPDASHVPTDISYLNVASDVGVIPQFELFGLTFDGDRMSAGDLLLAPGKDDPRAVPPFGGAAFDPRTIGRGRPDTVEWFLRQDVKIPFGAFVRTIQERSNAALDPYLGPIDVTHINFGDRFASIYVQSAGGVNLRSALLERMLGRVP